MYDYLELIIDLLVNLVHFRGSKLVVVGDVTRRAPDHVRQADHCEEPEDAVKRPANDVPVANGCGVFENEPNSRVRPYFDKDKCVGTQQEKEEHDQGLQKLGASSRFATFILLCVYRHSCVLTQVKAEGVISMLIEDLAAGLMKCGLQ